MAQNMSFEEWTGGATQAELKQMESAARKRYWIWLLLTFTVILAPITTGFCIFCYNNLSLIKSRGHSNGFGLWRFILVVWGLILLPIIIVQLLAHSDNLGLKVLGWNKV